MNPIKRVSTVMMLVMTLGLVMPTVFVGPASADISRPNALQPMTADCDGLGVFDVVSADKEFTNANTEGNDREKLPPLQATDSTLVLMPQSGTVVSVYTAIDHDPNSETNPQAIVPLTTEELGGYPPIFAIPPGHPYAYFGDFSVGNKSKKKNLVDCVVTDIGESDEGLQNWYPAGEGEAAVENCLVPDIIGDEQDECFVEGVVYHYTDIFVIKAHVSNSGGKAKALNAKHGGKHHGKRKRGH